MGHTISQEATGPLMVNLVLIDEQDLLSGEKMDNNPFNSRQIKSTRALL